MVSVPLASSSSSNSCSALGVWGRRFEVSMETRGCKSLPEAEFPASVLCCSASADPAEDLRGDKGTESFTAATPGEGETEVRISLFLINIHNYFTFYLQNRRWADFDTFLKSAFSALCLAQFTAELQKAHLDRRLFCSPMWSLFNVNMNNFTLCKAWCFKSRLFE